MGKKSTPKVPKTPDPQQLAESQTDINRNAIYDSARINRYDSSSPYGNVTWNRTDPNDPSTWTQQIQLSPEAQQQLDNQYGFSNSMYGAMNDRLNTMGGDFNYNGLPGVQYGVDTGNMPQLKTGLDYNSMPNVKSGLNYNALPSRQNNIQTNNLPQIQSGVNQSNLPQLRSSIDVSGLPQMQSSIDRGNLPQLSTGLNTGGLPELNKDYSQDASRVEQATYDRAMGLMNPEFDRQRSSIESRLATQGIPLGSEAYNDEVSRFEKTRNEAQLAAALDAVGLGRQEQSRMFDINQRARQQGVSEQLNSADLASGARGQLYGEQFNDAGLSERARQQGINEQLTGANLASNARNQYFNEGMQGANLNNAANQQLFGQNLTQAEFGNQARRDAVGEQLSDANLNNQARGQLTQEQLADAGLASGARSQYFGEGAQNIGYNNAGRSQAISERQLMRNQPLNELATLMGMSPQTQQYQPYDPAQYQIAPADYMGAQQLAYSGALNNYNNQLNSNAQKKGGATDLAGTLGAAYLMR